MTYNVFGGTSNLAELALLTLFSTRPTSAIPAKEHNYQ